MIQNSRPPLQSYLESLYSKYIQVEEGNLADYIPELARANPSSFAIAIVTVDGDIYQSGDSYEKFTIQSISKIVSYGMALSDHGLDYVTKKVGVEPSGDAFNSISLDPETGQPRNPMINAGAIVATSMVKAHQGEKPIDRILKTMRYYVGHETSVNEEVYFSEKKTGHRNRAIAHMLRSFNCIEHDPEPILDTYFRQCSMEINCRDLALIAGCLANDGVNPVTSEIALGSQYVKRVLSVMGTCGMYDFSGNWLYHVGMPAKSGVGGGILAVLPGQLGLAVFSPLLDKLGNSVRGIKVCEDFSRNYSLHLYQVPRSTSSSIVRVKFTGKEIRSRKNRTQHENNIIESNRAEILGYELQGNLGFGSSVSFIKEIFSDSCKTIKFLIIDFFRVVDIHNGAQKILADALLALEENGIKTYFVGMNYHYAFSRLLKIRLGKKMTQQLLRFPDRDRALEQCEDDLLPGDFDNISSLEESEFCFDNLKICNGFSLEECRAMESVATLVEYEKNDLIIKQGEIAKSMYFIVSGEFEAFLFLGQKREKRLATMAKGLTFGELAMLNDGVRSASVKAISNGSCYELLYKDIPIEIKTKMIVNLANFWAKKFAEDAHEILVMS